ncbi:thioredoxin-like protein [Jimgerdemannia flammicorona]|uniref:Thioredoxin-like protein n=1 Tax=Jimgerdemannia flammicorona TaxID=994334 RepID=A0A433CVY8_9FUNG|nr:thioredoxin-like protein [Jimgerdemannia flammicorona]
MSDTERDNTQTAADHEDLDDEALFEELEKEDDSETAFFREQRLEELKAEVTRRTQMRENEHGVYSEVMKEKTLMELTTTTERIVVHFFHKDFRRCDIMDKHLNELARTHFQTKFCKINVENAKFLVEKLKVQILPCVIAFINAIAVDRYDIIFFEVAELVWDVEHVGNGRGPEGVGMVKDGVEERGAMKQVREEPRSYYFMRRY